MSDEAMLTDKTHSPASRLLQICARPDVIAATDVIEASDVVAAADVIEAIDVVAAADAA
jgi:hypothetical protein